MDDNKVRKEILTAFYKNFGGHNMYGKYWLAQSNRRK